MGNQWFANIFFLFFQFFQSLPIAVKPVKPLLSLSVTLVLLHPMPSDLSNVSDLLLSLVLFQQCQQQPTRANRFWLIFINWVTFFAQPLSALSLLMTFPELCWNDASFFVETCKMCKGSRMRINVNKHESHE